MEKEQKDTLLKIRSSRACIRDGYQLFTTQFRRIFRVTWPLAIGFAIVSAVAKALPVLVSPTLLIPGVILETLAVIILLILTWRRLRKKDILIKTGKIPFIVCISHIGMILVVTLVCLIIVSILTMFAALPTIILMAANWESQMGVINCDPVGMPSYMTWLSVITFLAIGFLQAYVWISVICPLYLMRVSMAQQEQERENFNQKNHEESTIYRP